jgi:hypothetical protein
MRIKNLHIGLAVLTSIIYVLAFFIPYGESLYDVDENVKDDFWEKQYLITDYITAGPYLLFGLCWFAYLFIKGRAGVIFRLLLLIFGFIIFSEV